MKAAALKARELLATQPSVTEHEEDREVAGAGERLIDDRGLRCAQQPVVLPGAQALALLALGLLGARELDDQHAPAPVRAVAGELVAPVELLVDEFVQTLVAQPQTQRTYDRACRRFVAWLGPLAGPEDLTSTRVAAYHPVLAAGRASSTVKKERAAINSWLRWLVEFGHIPAEQARAALAMGGWGDDTLMLEPVLRELHREVPPGTFADVAGLATLKASERFLPDLLHAAGRDVAKRDFFLIAAQMRPDEIHPDVVEKLDQIAVTLSGAHESRDGLRRAHRRPPHPQRSFNDVPECMHVIRYISGDRP